MPIKKVIEAALQSNRFAVLATEGEGQPHASLIAITPCESYRQLIFATYRSTRKFRNLVNNGKVAVLFEVGKTEKSDKQKNYVITAIGYAEEIMMANHGSTLSAHLKRHPELEHFLRSSDCALFQVIVEAYQVVYGIDNIVWWTLDSLDKD